MNLFIRSYRYKPLSADEDEINRWRLLTKKYHYEMINQEPRVGVNGMWKEEVNAVDAKAIEFLKRHGGLKKTKALLTLVVDM